MRIHFIGICGVAMSALATAFHKKGHIVTGSDVGFYPPISTHLTNMGISYYAGWHPEHVLRTFVGDPDTLAIVGNVASSTNPEWVYVQEHHIPNLTYPEAVAKFFVRDHSIVVAGTYGKTSSTALLTTILTDAGYNPSYMFGALTVEPKDAAAVTDSDWSILEGDEYKSGRLDMRPKFIHYRPTHLLLTGLSWDHADVYPTEKEYFKAFETLVSSVPENGLIVANADDPGVLRTTAPYTGTRILFGKSSTADVQYSNITESINGLAFTIISKGKEYIVNSPMLGAFQAKNITGCFALAEAIGISPIQIITSISNFAGIKRRLEKRHTGSIMVFDDIAHSPAKATSALETLRKLTAGKLIAVFEPNSGNREMQAKPQYDQAFAAADEVIIPRLTKLKKDGNKTEEPMDGPELTEVIKATHKNVSHFDDDNALAHYLLSTAKEKDAIVFLGSHGFRGMIEETVKGLTSLHR